MNCHGTIHFLGDLVDGALPADRLAAVRAHLAICPRCTEFLESYRATGGIFAAATDVAVPREVGARLERMFAAN